MSQPIDALILQMLFTHWDPFVFRPILTDNRFGITRFYGLVFNCRLVRTVLVVLAAHGDSPNSVLVAATDRLTARFGVSYGQDRL